MGGASPGNMAYGATKAAFRQLAKTAAAELSQDGKSVPRRIKIGLVNPGMVLLN